jgi:predicted nucleic acid-binding protein
MDPAGGFLVDTNVLLRSIEAGHLMHAAARQALQLLTNAGASLFVSPQNMIEFWVVATRPTATNGLGLSSVQAAAEIANYKAAFQLLSDTPAIFPEWERIVSTYTIQGKQAHDARLVAVMKANGIGQILTFNTGDFQLYTAGEGITVVDPSAVASMP